MEEVLWEDRPWVVGEASCVVLPWEEGDGVCLGDPQDEALLVDSDQSSPVHLVVLAGLFRLCI